jgi:hypothetical protein
MSIFVSVFARDSPFVQTGAVDVGKSLFLRKFDMSVIKDCSTIDALHA